MLANTPRFLYRHLRAEPSVESLACSATPKELLAAVTAYEGKPERSTEDIAIAYAMLVALGYHDRRLVVSALANWQPKVLAWAREILSIVDETATSTTVQEYKAPRGRIAIDDPERHGTPTTIGEIR